MNGEIVQMIRGHIEDLKARGKHAGLVQQARQFKLSAQIFDAFGKTANGHSVPDWFAASDADIEHQLQIAGAKPGREGIPMVHGRRYADPSDPSRYMDFEVDAILFAADEECLLKLHAYAERGFHGLNDEYLRQFAAMRGCHNGRENS